MKAHIEQDTLSPESAVDRVVLAAAGIVKSYRRGVWPLRHRVPVLTGADISLHPGRRPTTPASPVSPTTGDGHCP